MSLQDKVFWTVFGTMIAAFVYLNLVLTVFERATL